MQVLHKIAVAGIAVTIRAPSGSPLILKYESRVFEPSRRTAIPHECDGVVVAWVLRIEQRVAGVVKLWPARANRNRQPGVERLHDIIESRGIVATGHAMNRALGPRPPFGDDLLWGIIDGVAKAPHRIGHTATQRDSVTV